MAVDQLETSTDQINNRAPRVVIVDDDADILDVLTLLFQDEGFDTLACKTAETALDTLRATRTDLLITDLRLGEVGGLDLVRNISQLGMLMPQVILLTAVHKPELEENPLLRQVGARIVNKPFDIDQLIASARELIDRQG